METGRESEEHSQNQRDLVWKHAGQAGQRIDSGKSDGVIWNFPIYLSWRGEILAELGDCHYFCHCPAPNEHGWSTVLSGHPSFICHRRGLLYSFLFLSGSLSAHKAIDITADLIQVSAVIPALGDGWSWLSIHWGKGPGLWNCLYPYWLVGMSWGACSWFLVDVGGNPLWAVTLPGGRGYAVEGRMS